MTVVNKARVQAIAALAGVGIVVLSAQQPPSLPGYTAAQAQAGRTAYATSCAGCHRADLLGANEAPPLTGGNFRNTWGDRPVSELTRYVMAAMPPWSNTCSLLLDQRIGHNERGV